MDMVLAYVIHIVFLLLYLIGGTIFIESATKSFIHKNYLKFSFNAMMSIYFILHLAKHIFGGL